MLMCASLPPLTSSPYSPPSLRSTALQPASASCPPSGPQLPSPSRSKMVHPLTCSFLLIAPIPSNWLTPNSHADPSRRCTRAVALFYGLAATHPPNHSRSLL